MRPYSVTTAHEPTFVPSAFDTFKEASGTVLLKAVAKVDVEVDDVPAFVTLPRFRLFDNLLSLGGCSASTGSRAS